MLDANDIQVIRDLLAEERKHTEAMLAEERKRADEKFAEERKHADEKFDEERKRADIKFDEERKRADEKFDEERKRADIKFDEERKRSDEKFERIQQQMHDDMMSVLESDVYPKLQLLAEGHEAILEKLTPANEIESMKADIVVLKEAVRQLSARLNTIQMAQ